MIRTSRTNGPALAPGPGTCPCGRMRGLLPVNRASGGIRDSAGSPGTRRGPVASEGLCIQRLKRVTMQKQSVVRLGFGKHRGCALCDVPTAYLLWLLSTPDLTTPLREACRHELRRREGESLALRFARDHAADVG